MCLGAVRTLLGLVATASPSLVARPWIGGEAAELFGNRVLGRALGGRDLALGLGLLATAAKGGPTRAWVEAGVLSDLIDAGITVAAAPRLPATGRWLVLGSAAGAACVGVAAAWSMSSSPVQLGGDI